MVRPNIQTTTVYTSSETELENSYRREPRKHPKTYIGISTKGYGLPHMQKNTSPGEHFVSKAILVGLTWSP